MWDSEFGPLEPSGRELFNNDTGDKVKDMLIRFKRDCSYQLEGKSVDRAKSNTTEFSPLEFPGPTEDGDATREAEAEVLGRVNRNLCFLLKAVLLHTCCKRGRTKVSALSPSTYVKLNLHMLIRG